MDVSALSDGERRFLEELNARNVRFLVVGLAAAALQGATIGTQDIDLWFEDLADPAIGEAARAAGGLWVSGSFGMRPPALGGEVLGDRFDVVTHVHGLGPFVTEYEGARELRLSGVDVRVLPLDRIIASKRALSRSRDRAHLPALEEALLAMQETPVLTPGSEALDAAIARLSKEAESGAPTAEARIAAARTHAVPVHVDMGGVLLVGPGGTVLHFDPATSLVTSVEDRWRITALLKASRQFPELQELAPQRPATAATCAQCAGSGLVVGVDCGECMGLGWVSP